MNRMIPKLVLLLVLLMSAFGMNANPIDMRTAQEVAVKFMNANTKTPLRGTDDLQLVTTYNISRGDVAFYVFNTSNGFVIVSADDCATPILGYSNEGRFDVENIPIQLQDYLQGFVEQIQYGIENHVGAKENVMREWELVRTTGRLTENRDGEVVEPLITAIWGQGCYYNAMCPEHENNGFCDHCVTGCTATAMAQILHYWGYPEHGTGSHTYTPPGYPEQSVDFGATTYDWNNMPNSLSSTSSSEQINAIATLMWHCGVSVDMHYGPMESGGSLSPSSLIDYFNYSDDMHREYRQNDESWMSLLKTDLDVGRPVFYVGSNNYSGHAFVCDGYDANDRFHFNWGWWGADNGYFALNDIEYCFGNYAIFNIHPNASISYQVTASANPSDGGLVSGAGMHDIGSICTLTATANEGYAFMYWTEDGEVVSTQGEYSFCVRKDRVLVAHFATSYYIGVMVDPEEGGTVSGAGEYTYGSTCTLTASTNEGYDFICWRWANGNVVTTAPTCSFTVTEATTLTAVFAVSGGERIPFADLNVKAICVAHWDTNGDGELSYSEAHAVTNLGNVFRGNSSILSFNELQYFDNLTSIGYYAFSYCSGLTSIGISTAVTSIGDHAFYYCTSLTSIEIPNSVTSISSSAFEGCSGLTTIEIPNSVTVIGNNAFRGCSGFTGNLTVPNSVTVIGNNAFYGCSGFTGSLTIPNSVSTIGEYAFYNCSGFTGSLTLGNSLTTIGSCAFAGCSGFTGGLTIPNSVTTIGDGAFSNCRGFTGSLTIPDSVTSIGDSAFSRCSGFTGSLTIGNSVTSIGQHAFRECSGFTGSLTIPNSVTMISNFAFYNCSGFTGSLIIPNSVTLIGGYAFSYCRGLTGDLIIGDSVTSIGGWAFNGCSGFTGNLTLGNSLTTIGIAAFGCRGLTSMTVLADNPPTLGYGAFGSVNKSIPVYVPCNSMEAYHNAGGWSEFTKMIELCSGEVVVTVNPSEGGTVTGAGYYEGGDLCVLTATPNPGFDFGNWTENGVVVSRDTVYSFIAHATTIVANFCSYSPIVFADANVKALCVANWDTNGDGELSYAEAAVVPSLGEVFRNQSSITSFDELQYFIGLSSIGNDAFYYCRNLTSIEIPKSVTSIGSLAFLGCTGLEQIIVDSENMAYDSREDCNAIIETNTNELVIGCKNTVIPNSVCSIGNSAFSYCSGLTSIEIPNSVTSIGSSAFSYCSGLTSIEIPNSVSSIGNSAFYYCTGLTSIELSNSVTSIASNMFVYCRNLTSIEIPNSVTSIGGFAFYYCTGLTSMTILADNPPTVGDIYAFANVNKSIPVYVPCGSLEAYQNTGGWNEFTNYREVCIQAQTITLAAGTNWFSTYLDITLDDLKAALLAAMPNNNATITIKSMTQDVKYQDGSWAGSLTAFSKTQMYKIIVSEACEITLEGMPIDPTTLSLTITPGANWIAFPYNESMSVTDFFGSFPIANDVVKSQMQNTRYKNGRWAGQLNTLMPGQGYIYKSASTEARTFTFPISAK